MAGGVALSLESIRDKRPYFDSETGPIDDWIVNPSFDAEYHHNMSWAHLAAGGAGSGMRWPYTTPHWILPEMRDNLLGLARLAATIDWTNFDSRNVGRSIFTSRREILDMGITDGETALIWLLLDTRTDESVTFAGAFVSFSDLLEPGAYSVEFWETYEGRVLTTIPLVVSAGQIEIPIPDLDEALKDVALVIRRQP
jgi:mannan endo-1,4-beta-mannosidase